jgi:hypothetical protein
VQRDVVALRIEPAEGTLPAGTPVQLKLFSVNAKGGQALIPGNLTAWSGSRDSVADVNRQGRLSPRSPGTVTVTARYGGQTATATFTVVAAG